MILNEDTTKRVYDEFSPDSQYWLLPGDLLVQRANTLEYVGTAAIYDGPPRNYIYPDLMMRLRFHEPATTQYVRYFLADERCRRFFRENATGTAGNMPKINGQVVRATPILLPPLNEQRRIVAKIDALMARSRRAKESLDAIPPLLERLRQSILAAAFRGDLTADWRAQNPDVEPAEQLLERIRTERRRRWEEATLEKMRAKGKVPTGDGWKAKYEEPHVSTRVGRLPPTWRWATVDELSSTITSGSRDWKKYYGRGDGVFVLAGNVRRGFLDLSERLHVDAPRDDPDAVRSRVHQHDVLMTIVGANTGDVCEVEAVLDDHYVCQSVALIRPIEPTMASWMVRHFGWGAGRAHLEKLMYGQGRPHLSFDDLRDAVVPVAPVEEQKAINRIVNEVESAIQTARRAAAAAEERQSRLESSILQTAFRGELVPQDPNDEPAEQMLARLASTEAPAKKAKRGGARQKDA